MHRFRSCEDIRSIRTERLEFISNYMKLVVDYSPLRFFEVSRAVLELLFDSEADYRFDIEFCAFISSRAELVLINLKGSLQLYKNTCCL